MSLSECIKAYKALSKSAFTERNLLNRTIAKVTIGPKFKTAALEDAIKNTVRDKLGDAEKALLWTEYSPCKV